MTPFAASRICSADHALFGNIKQAVSEMQDPDLGTDENGRQIILSCHILVRAIIKIYEDDDGKCAIMKVCDGHFAGFYEHSWIETRDGNIIDVYPVGIVGGPIMWVGDRHSPSSRIFSCKPTEEFSHGRFEKESFQRAVHKTMEALRG